jgi:hypothetical protein
MRWKYSCEAIANSFNIATLFLSIEGPGLALNQITTRGFFEEKNDRTWLCE